MKQVWKVSELLCKLFVVSRSTFFFDMALRDFEWISVKAGSIVLPLSTKYAPGSYVNYLTVLTPSGIGYISSQAFCNVVDELT